MLSTPLLVSYATALTGTSYALFGNIGSKRWALRQVLTEEVEILPTKPTWAARVSIWERFYDLAKADMLLNFIPVLPSLGTIAYYSSPHSVQRKLAITSVVTFALVFPWTLYSIMPVNRQLFKINAAKDEQLAGEKAQALFDAFQARHDVRIGLFFTSWAALVAGVLMRVQ